VSFDPTLRWNEQHDAAKSKLRARAFSEHGTEFVAAWVEWSTKNNEPRESMTGLALKSEENKATSNNWEQNNEAPVNDGSGWLMGDVVISIIVHSMWWNVG
jgi:hypothetical protein